MVQTNYGKQECFILGTCQKRTRSANVRNKFLKKFSEKFFRDKFEERSLIFKAIE